MSSHNEWNRGGGNVKDLFASYLYGLCAEFEEAVAEAEMKHRRDFVTKTELRAAVAKLERADAEQTKVLKDFIQQVDKRFNCVGGNHDGLPSERST